VIVFAAVAPHGDLGLDPALRSAMEELGRRFETAAPDAAIVVTPHNVHVEGHFAVVVAGKVRAWETGREWDTDRELAGAVLAALRNEGLPAVGISFGGNDAAGAEHPSDWGTEVPLEHLHAQRIVVVSPARDRPLDEHVRAGRALRTLAGRYALVASADHGHAHDAEGPYGFDPAAAVYDEKLLEILGSGRLDFRPLAEHAEAGKADSLWQLLVLQGAVGEDARATLLAYAAPTYYGMAVAEVSA
jgi:aromatic ring-opening dioxygenase LigB subunit